METKKIKQVPLLIETDFEPDDKLALALLYMSGKWKFDIIVVGERNSGQLVQVAKQYMSDIFKQDHATHIVQGIGSSVKFAGEGQEFDKFQIEESKIIQFDEIIKNYRQCLIQFLSSHESPTMLILKPCRELFTIWDEPEVTKLLNKTTLFMYASFNMRVVLGRKYEEKNRARFLKMLSSFKRVNWFESFHAISPRGRNSMNHSNMPEFFSLLDRSEHVLAKLLKASATLWTKHMLSNIRDKNSKLYKDLIADPEQMVAADSFLACCMNANVDSYPCALNITDQGFTELKSVDKESTNILVYRDIEWKQFESELVAVLGRKMSKNNDATILTVAVGTLTGVIGFLWGLYSSRSCSAIVLSNKFHKMQVVQGDNVYYTNYLEIQHGVNYTSCGPYAFGIQDTITRNKDGSITVS